MKDEEEEILDKEIEDPESEEEEEVIESEPEVKSKISSDHKGTDRFKKTIEDYLLNKALADELFAVTFKKENKNIDDCISYILNTVKDSGCNGFTDEEIFSMAIHYYDEDDIKVGSSVSMNVIVNHKVELTEEEINEAKEQAKKRAEEAQYKKMTKKIKVVHSEPTKTVTQQSLF